MKKHLSTVATVLALVIAVVSQFRISNLQSEIHQLENQLNNSVSMLQSNQSAALSRMQELMEQEASILTQTNFSLDELDLADKTFVLSGSVTPKEHQPGVTEAFLTVNGKAYPMELANGTYTIQLDLPVFEDARVEKVEFREDDVIRTETLDEQWSPRYELLPSVHGRLGGSGRGTAANGVYTWHREGEVRINVEGKGQVIDVRSVTLVEELDGVEVGRTEIPLTSTESTQRKNAKEEPAPPPTSGIQVDGAESFYHMIDREFNIPFGSTLELLAEVVDGNGLRYRTVLEYWAVNEKGEPVDDDYFGLRDLFEQILDTDGNVLYEVDEADYR
ncbi:MAG: hypothetical protein J6A62_02060 [Oscillospiraceae bacterium]|nr:hypothetical protein [Oscillospiraceae bacterium]